jgi:hypothetical protein
LAASRLLWVVGEQLEYATGKGERQIHAGDHCEASGRRLFHQRAYDWLDETLAS